MCEIYLRVRERIGESERVWERKRWEKRKKGGKQRRIERTEWMSKGRKLWMRERLEREEVERKRKRERVTVKEWNIKFFKKWSFKVKMKEKTSFRLLLFRTEEEIDSERGDRLRLVFLWDGCLLITFQLYPISHTF